MAAESRCHLRATNTICPLGAVSRNILLLGTTGSGKSATGNSILLAGNDGLFQTSDDCQSCTSEIKAEWKEYTVTDSGGKPSVTYMIKVIDGPGLRDTNYTKAEDQRTAYRNIANVLTECEAGIHAFVFVVRLSVRFNKEDKDAYDYLKKVLGKNFMKKYGVVVVAGYDYLNKDDKKNDEFRQWCLRQTSFLKTVFTDCNYRCVAFDNKTEDMSQKKEQLETLLEMMHGMLQNNGETAYTTKLFNDFAREYKKVMQSSGYEVIKEDFRRQLSLLKSKIKEIETKEHLAEAITAQTTLSTDVQFEVAKCGMPRKLEGHLRELGEILGNMNGVEVHTKKFKLFCKKAHIKIEDMNKRANFCDLHCNPLLKLFSLAYWESYF